MIRDSVAAGRSFFTDEDKEDVIEDIRDVLESDTLTAGALCTRFEAGLQALLQGQHVVAVSSGTTALEAALLAAGVGPDDEVIVQANTFVATAAAVHSVGAKVAFVDSMSNTLGPSADQIAEALAGRTRAVIVTHLGGVINCELPRIQKLCESANVTLLEDAAQALGSTLDDLPVGSWSSAATLSFYQRKVLTTGEGGAVVSASAKFGDVVRLLKDQGRASDGTHVLRGLNWRLTELQAALGCAQLRRWQEIITTRRRLFSVYSGLMAGWSPRLSSRVLVNGYKFWLHLPDRLPRDIFTREMAQQRVFLPGPLSGHEQSAHLQPAYRDCRRVGDLIETEIFAKSHACLPLYPSLTEQQVRNVAEAALAVLARWT